MQKIINWNAKRAGGRITIHGIDPETQRPIKIVGIDEITGGLTVDGVRKSPSVAVRHSDGAIFEMG